jgi:hypothetical protein
MEPYTDKINKKQGKPKHQSQLPDLTQIKNFRSQTKLSHKPYKQIQVEHHFKLPYHDPSNPNQSEWYKRNKFRLTKKIQTEKKKKKLPYLWGSQDEILVQGPCRNWIR